MDRKLVLASALLIVIMGIVPNMVLADISVGVKKGDWIEYQVTYTGTPPPRHDATWARMEIADVQGKIISLNMVTKFSNGTQIFETSALNLETGQLGDDFIIPANLVKGDTFYDKNLGNVTISGVEEISVAGATRTVVSATTYQTTFYWDQATGVTVEASSNFTNYNYTLASKADKTNMWQPQILGLNPTLFYALATMAAVILVVVALLAFFVIRRKK